jgi:putative membrane protein
MRRSHHAPDAKANAPEGHRSEFVSESVGLARSRAPALERANTLFGSKVAGPPRAAARPSRRELWSLLDAFLPFRHPSRRAETGRGLHRMTTLYDALVALHVAANLVWIGAILSVAVTLGSSEAGEGRVGAQIAYELYRKLAVPAFVVSFVTALARFSLEAKRFLADPNMHPKLLFAVIVIALHHVIGARAKAVATGRRSSPGPVGVLGLLLLISALAATLFVVVRPFGRMG